MRTATHDQIEEVLAFLGDDPRDIVDYLLWALDNPTDAKGEIIRYNNKLKEL